MTSLTCNPDSSAASTAVALIAAENFAHRCGLTRRDVGGIAVPRGMAGGLLLSAPEVEWSLTRFRESMRQEKKAEAWDEQEKSVLTKLDDDILAGVRSGRVSITILKSVLLMWGVMK